VVDAVARQGQFQEGAGKAGAFLDKGEQAARGGESVAGGGTITQMASQIVDVWAKQAFNSGLSWAKAKIAASSSSSTTTTTAAADACAN
jgi:hypothetical protein